MASTPELDTAEYRTLSEFRYHIHKFLHFSENAAKQHGLEPRQHQMLLAVRGLPEGVEPTVGEIAKRLFLRHHSTGELVDRLEKIGAVRRERSVKDAREVLIRLTAEGEALLRELSIAHRQELESAGLELAHAIQEVIGTAEISK